MKQILKDFANIGTSGIGFTGGEPLLRKDIFEMLAYTKALGMISHLNTNGSLLDERNIANILEARVDSLNISLDGATAETHDKIRGHRGAFDRAVEAISRVIAVRKRKGAVVRLKTVAVLQKDNIDEAADMVQLAEDLGVDCIEFIPLQPFAVRADHQSCTDPLFLGKVDKVADYLIGPKSKAVRIENSQTHIQLFHRSFSNAESPLTCYAGYNSLAVDCYGEIYPCVPWFNWRRSVGDVRSKDLTSFWYSAEYNRIREEMRSCRKCYLNCQAELNILFNVVRSQKTSKKLWNRTQF
jgi:MoaA/NifB/PqqE/SkfB family radical SAM enzyme